MNTHLKKYVGIFVCLGVSVFVIFFGKQVSIPQNMPAHFQAASALVVGTPPAALSEVVDSSIPAVQIPSHVALPKPLRGLYVSSWVAGTQSTINRIINLIDTTSANAIIIDIKDATGRISYMPKDESLISIGSGTTRIRNLPALIERLHEKNIYVIGRISVFQDPFYATKFPDAAYKDTRTGLTWHDNKGLSWVKNNSLPFWEYTVRIAKDAYAQGFDEINLDYVRYPSDGPLSYLDTAGMEKGRTGTMSDFFSYVSTELRSKEAIPISADLFGLTMSAQGDLGIGQILELVAPHVDYVAPMVYPSHFAKGTYGIADPARQPYAIIYKSLSDGIARMQAIGEDVHKLRPWLQDFNLGAVYTHDLVQAQITAAEELGLTSWMLWDPRNIYTKSVL